MLAHVSRLFVSRSAATLGSVAALRSYSTSEGPLKKTKLYDFHVHHGAKIVPFCGWEMPLQYADGIIQSHVFTRTNAGLFDVSHMLQLRFTGKDRINFIQELVVADVHNQKEGTAAYTVLTNEKGGIIDDAIVSKYNDHLYVVVNAGCADKDFQHFTKHVQRYKSAGKDINLEVIDQSLLALQGPKAKNVLSKLVDGSVDLSKFYFLNGTLAKVAGIPCRVTRCGYTGEDGFEISVPHERAVELAEKLVADQDVRLAGLGPRDTLRLEAGLCLYGQDLTEDITPIEATLAWTLPKTRRESGGFLGADVVLKQLKEGTARKRVGFLGEGKRIPRTHAQLLDPNTNQVVGEVSSGAYGPSLDKPVGMAYVQKEVSKIGTVLNAKIGSTIVPVRIAKMPFYPNGYYNPPA